jgi:hypothetical protein
MASPQTSIAESATSARLPHESAYVKKMQACEPGNLLTCSLYMGFCTVAGVQMEGQKHGKGIFEYRFFRKEGGRKSDR